MIFDSSHCTVEDTAKDAANGKWSATRAGYYKDKYIDSFIDIRHTLLPHQNLGYFLRYSLMKKAATTFYSIHGPESQVVVIGCGFDSLFWQLRDEDITFKHWFDLDKTQVITDKGKVIQTKLFQPINNYFLKEIDFNISPDFISSIEGFENIPTLFVDEFSMIYFDSETYTNVLNTIGSLPFKDIYFAGYGMILPDDDFGMMVQEGFEKLGIPLKSYKLTPTLQDIIDLYKTSGFQCANAVDCEAMLKHFFDETEKKRIFSLECFDDPKTLFYLYKHYCAIVAGSKEFVSILQKT